MLRVGHTPLKLGDGRVLTMGDPIPEAQDFQNLQTYFNTHMVVDDESFDPDMRAAARLGDALRLDLPEIPELPQGGGSAPPPAAARSSKKSATQ